MGAKGRLFDGMFDYQADVYFIKWDNIQFILAQPVLVGRALGAIQNSFIIALIVAKLSPTESIGMTTVAGSGTNGI